MMDKRRYKNAMIGTMIGYVGLIVTVIIMKIMAQL